MNKRQQFCGKMKSYRYYSYNMEVFKVRVQLVRPFWI